MITALKTIAVILISLIQRSGLSASMHDNGRLITAMLQTTFCLLSSHSSGSLSTTFFGHSSGDLQSHCGPFHQRRFFAKSCNGSHVLRDQQDLRLLDKIANKMDQYVVGSSEPDLLRILSKRGWVCESSSRLSYGPTSKYTARSSYPKF